MVSGMATANITVKNVARVLHRAGFYSPVKLVHNCKSSDVSDLQSPMDGGRAVMITSGVAWVYIERVPLTFQLGALVQIKIGKIDTTRYGLRNAYKQNNSNELVARVLQRAGSLTLQRRAVVAVQFCEALQIPNLTG